MSDSIKDKVEAVVNKIKNDKSIAEKFKKDPAATVKSLLKVDLPDDQLKKIVEAVKGKVSLDKIGDVLGGLLKK